MRSLLWLGCDGGLYSYCEVGGRSCPEDTGVLEYDLVGTGSVTSGAGDGASGSKLHASGSGFGRAVGWAVLSSCMSMAIKGVGGGSLVLVGMPFIWGSGSWILCMVNKCSLQGPLLSHPASPGQKVQLNLYGALIPWNSL